jgi:hypothetical protein
MAPPAPGPVGQPDPGPAARRAPPTTRPSWPGRASSWPPPRPMRRALPTSCARRSSATTSGSRASARSTATGSSPSCCRTSRASTTRPSTRPSSAGWPTTGPATTTPSGARGGTATAPPRSWPGTRSTSRTRSSTRSTRALLALGGRFALRAQRIVQALLERSLDPGCGIVLGPCRRGRAPDPRLDLVFAGPAGAARDPRGGQARAGRAPAPAPAARPRRHRDPVGGDQRADLQPALGPLSAAGGGRRGWPRRGCSCPRCASSGTPRRPTTSVDSLVRAVRRPGLRQYDDPLTGDGLGARRFAMSALVLDLLTQPRLEP